MVGRGRCAPCRTLRTVLDRRAARVLRALRQRMRRVVKRDRDGWGRVRERQRQLRTRCDFDGIGRLRDARGNFNLKSERRTRYRCAKSNQRRAAAATWAGALMAGVMRVGRVVRCVRVDCAGRHFLAGRHGHRGRGRCLMYRRIHRRAMHRARIPLHRTGNRHRKRGAAHQRR